jgi:hypothetical protein
LAGYFGMHTQYEQKVMQTVLKYLMVAIKYNLIGLIRHSITMTVQEPRYLLVMFTSTCHVLSNVCTSFPMSHFCQKKKLP